MPREHLLRISTLIEYVPLVGCTILHMASNASELREMKETSKYLKLVNRFELFTVVLLVSGINSCLQISEAEIFEPLNLIAIVSFLILRITSRILSSDFSAPLSSENWLKSKIIFLPSVGDIETRP